MGDDLYDGEAQHVAAEPENQGSNGGGRRTDDEAQPHAEDGRPGTADDDLVLQRHEQPYHASTVDYIFSVCT